MTFLNPTNAAFATAYLVDKIVGVYRGSYAPAVGTTLVGTLYQYAIPHSFTRPVFCELSWSTDGVTYRDGGSILTGGTQGAIAYSDSSNVYITTISNAGTIYYKLVCSWIDNYDSNDPQITPVLDTTGSVYFDSRKNYPKIFTTGTTTFSGTGTKTVSHGLSYAPNFKAYFESMTGQVWPLISGGSSDFWLYSAAQNECEAYTTDTGITFTHTGPATTRTIWYRVYL